MQSAAIPEVLAGGDVLLASHTGSGKTLAYLLPLVPPRCPPSKLPIRLLCTGGPFGLPYLACHVYVTTASAGDHSTVRSKTWGGRLLLISLWDMQCSKKHISATGGRR